MEEEQKKSLVSRMFDTVILTAASAVVLTLLGAAVTFMWDKAVNVDASIDRALVGVEVIQKVAAEEIDKLKESVNQIQMQSFNDRLTKLEEAVYKNKVETYVKTESIRPVLPSKLERPTKEINETDGTSTLEKFSIEQKRIQTPRR